MAEQKGWQGNFFEDFDLEQRIACPPPRRIGEGETAAYIALTGDRTARYCGEGALVHPLLVFHTVMGQTVRPISLNARANLGYAGMIFQRPVRVGTTLSTTVEVIGLKENSSQETGIVWVRTVGRDASDAPVLEYVRWVMVNKRGGKATRWLDDPVVPELPKAVRSDALPLPNEDLPRPKETGGRFLFEDYRRGERVFHHDGQTLNASDHMSFTRLFQNSAKVHFDALLTEGRPLVYGGLPMSLGYAQALNGFEHRLGLAAINGGQHANPVYAGDTLYAFSEIREVDALGEGPVGALRVSLYVLKNVNPADQPDFVVRPEGGRHAPEVVLDLDYWELMPKRGAV